MPTFRNLEPNAPRTATRSQLTQAETTPEEPQAAPQAPEEEPSRSTQTPAEPPSGRAKSSRSEA